MQVYCTILIQTNHFTHSSSATAELILINVKLTFLISWFTITTHPGYDHNFHD